jgi:hypothetical protein
VDGIFLVSRSRSRGMEGTEDEKPMRPRNRPSIVITIVSVAILAACASPSGSPDESEAASAPAASNAEPTASAAAELEVTFAGTVPDGWSQDGDGAIPTADPEEVFVEVGQGFQVMSADCAGEPEPGVGEGASAFADAIAAREGLDATEPEPITVDGLSGFLVDFTAAEDGTGATCVDPDANLVFVPLWVAADGGFAGAAPSEENRLIVLDTPSSGLLLIWLWAPAPGSLDEHLDSAMSVVEGLQIEAP